MTAIVEGRKVLRKAGAKRPEAASYFMDYAYQYLEPDDGADYGLAAMEKWPLANSVTETR